MALWAILALAMVVPRANRTREVLLILVPVVLVNLVWLAITPIFKPVISDQEMLGAMALSLAVGSAVLWLLGHVLANRTRYQGIVLALGVALGVTLAGTLPIVDFSEQAFAFASLLGVLMPAMVLGYVLAGRMSHGAYRPTRFLLLLASGTVVSSGMGVLLWLLLTSAVTGSWPAHLILTLGVFFVAGSISGACVFLVSLLFVLVGLRSPLFRPRLFACLRMQLVPGPVAPPAQTDSV